MDIVVALYLATAILSTYGFCLFSWWWFRLRRASYMYTYVTALLGGLAINYWMNFYARMYRGSHTYVELLDTWFWAARLVLILLCVLAIVVHMTYRVFVLNKRLTEGLIDRRVGTGRRATDRNRYE